MDQFPKSSLLLRGTLSTSAWTRSPKGSMCMSIVRASSSDTSSTPWHIGADGSMAARTEADGAR